MSAKECPNCFYPIKKDKEVEKQENEENVDCPQCFYQNNEDEQENEECPNCHYKKS